MRILRWLDRLDQRVGAGPRTKLDRPLAYRLMAVQGFLCGLAILALVAFLVIDWATAVVAGIIFLLGGLLALPVVLRLIKPRAGGDDDHEQAHAGRSMRGFLREGGTEGVEADGAAGVEDRG